jgi:hypothetical protein
MLNFSILIRAITGKIGEGSGGLVDRRDFFPRRTTHAILQGVRVRVYNATFNNISVISLHSV